VREADWNRFVNDIGQVEIPRLEYLFGGLKFRLPKPCAKLKRGLLTGRTPRTEDQYITDGSEPDTTSAVYLKPIPIQGSVKIKALHQMEKEAEPPKSIQFIRLSNLNERYLVRYQEFILPVECIFPKLDLYLGLNQKKYFIPKPYYPK